MNTNELFRIGVITEPHGVRGEVKVYPTTGDPGRVKKLKEVILDTGKEQITLHIKSVKHAKQLLILGFDEFENRDEVLKLNKKELFVTRENAIKLNKDEYYVSDLIGLKVIDEESIDIGVVKDVLETGANDVYEIERIDGTMLYLPAIKECIKDVNIEEGYMKVYVMPGL